MIVSIFLSLSHCTLDIFTTGKQLRGTCPNTEFFSGPYFPVFGLNTGKYGPEKTPYSDTFHVVNTSTIEMNTDWHYDPYIFRDLKRPLKWLKSKITKIKENLKETVKHCPK